MTIPNPAFEITQKVFHVTPDSPQGVIVDARYLLFDKRWEYLVGFGPGQTLAYYEHEISTNKTF